MVQDVQGPDAHQICPQEKDKEKKEDTKKEKEGEKKEEAAAGAESWYVLPCSAMFYHHGIVVRFVCLKIHW